VNSLLTELSHSATGNTRLMNSLTKAREALRKDVAFAESLYLM
jgi:hypothetical protein